MKKTTFPRSRIAVAVAGAALALGANQALGSAFALQEQNGSGLGNAFAGGAAVAEDASTTYFNPAGLTRLRSPQFAAAGDVICYSASFHDSGSQPAAFQPPGGSGGDAGNCSVVPNLYVAVPFASQWSFGLGVNVPFGLKTEYDSDWIGRFQAVNSKVETINVNPSIAWQATPQLSLGAGVSWQRLKATLTQQVNYAGAFAQGVGAAVAGGLVPAAAAPTLIGAGAGLESGASVTGDDSAWGWNVGALWQVNDATRFGASYRSRIKFHIDGNIDISNPTALGALPPTLAPVGAAIMSQVSADPLLQSGGIKLNIELPDTANVSVFTKLNNQWDLMGDIQYTGWSSIQELRIERISGAAPSVTPENFRDSWRFSVGANYHYNDAWMFRGGLAYDQSPVRDAERTPRLPDEDRTWLALGVQYKFNPQLALDVGYTHIFIKDPNINQNAGSTASYGLINGNYSSDVNIVGLQLTYSMR
jgi:long-chain fatty acid transport protein